MARKYSTLRACFVKNKTVATTNKVKTPPDFTAPVAYINPPKAPHQACISIKPPPDVTVSGLSVSTLLNDTLPTTLETLRSHVNYLLRLPLPVAEKNRLRLKYWAMQRRLEAVRLLLDCMLDEGPEEVEIKFSETGSASVVDPSCFDFSEFNLAEFDLSSVYLSLFD